MGLGCLCVHDPSLLLPQIYALPLEGQRYCNDSTPVAHRILLRLLTYIAWKSLRRVVVSPALFRGLDGNGALNRGGSRPLQHFTHSAAQHIEIGLRAGSLDSRYLNSFIAEQRAIVEHFLSQFRTYVLAQVDSGCGSCSYMLGW